MVEKQSAFLTVKYKLHNPSQRRRAMLLDAMRRAHLGYWSALFKWSSINVSA